MVRRDRGEGWVDVSASSTSNDRFSAGKHRTFQVRQETEVFKIRGAQTFPCQGPQIAVAFGWGLLLYDVFKND